MLKMGLISLLQLRCYPIQVYTLSDVQETGGGGGGNIVIFQAAGSEYY